MATVGFDGASITGQNINTVSFLRGVHAPDPVSGHTHTYYRYPARFSPQFARAAIEAFTKPGDVVLDPFMGGGTSLVEAFLTGRHGIGTDINALAVFIASAKTDPPSADELEQVLQWAMTLSPLLNLRRTAVRATEWIDEGYQRNIGGRATWRVRKTLELALSEINRLESERQRLFARCALLRTAQWALDCREHIPSVGLFRQQLLSNFHEMATAANALYRDAKSAAGDRAVPRPLCLNRPVVGLECDERLIGLRPPKLVLTSPPYPGVHVLYHRWQVQGRRETPAPFWIAAQKDGMGASYYTFGDRKSHTKGPYYEGIKAAFASIARLSDNQTLVVQLIAFSDPTWQLERYLQTMEEAGFEPVLIPGLSNETGGPVWRSVPGRKWYVNQCDNVATSREAVLVHRLRRVNSPANQDASPE